jgi:hypothetical protein
MRVSVAVLLVLGSSQLLAQQPTPSGPLARMPVKEVMNSVGRITWNVTLSAGQGIDLNYEWQYYWR